MIQTTKVLVTLAAAIVSTMVAVRSARAADAEEACQKGRYLAAAKYAACHLKIALRDAAPPGVDGMAGLLRKCRTKYAATWARLQTKAIGTGSTCDNPRFVDNGDGTVIDRLTNLRWEQKTEDGTIHDVNHLYTWGGSVEPTGTAYKIFLASLNGSTCFANACDWRLPTLAELQTLATERGRA